MSLWSSKEVGLGSGEFASQAERLVERCRRDERRCAESVNLVTMVQPARVHPITLTESSSACGMLSR
jgi:hypothetical protein